MHSKFTASRPAHKHTLRPKQAKVIESNCRQECGHEDDIDRVRVHGCLTQGGTFNFELDISTTRHRVIIEKMEMDREEDTMMLITVRSTQDTRTHTPNSCWGEDEHTDLHTLMSLLTDMSLRTLITMEMSSSATASEGLRKVYLFLFQLCLVPSAWVL